MVYSIIVPVYNVEQYLPRCLDSLVRQTFDDYEIILIDDGSTDGSNAILHNYKRLYRDKIKIIEKENGGQGTARNCGLDIAKGEYILFVDSDDYVDLDMLQKLNNIIEKKRFDVILFGWYEVTGEGIRSFHEEERIVKPESYFQTSVGPVCKAIKASFFRDHPELRFPGGIIYEDLAMMPCLRIYAKEIYAVGECFYYYVKRDTSTMHIKDIDRMLNKIRAVEFACEYFKAEDKFDECYSELEYLAIRHILIYTTADILRQKYSERHIQKLLEYMNKRFTDYKTNQYIDKLFNAAERKQINLLSQGKIKELDRKFYMKSRIKSRLKGLINGKVRKY